MFVRIGGDEFCVVIPECTQETAQQKFAEILQKFSGEKSRVYPKSFSFGIVDVTAGHEALRTEEIMQRADEVMYEQKRQHKEAYQKELQ